MVAARPLQILLGGSWHDFAGFGYFARELLEPLSWELSISFDANALLRLDSSQARTLLMFTCYDSAHAGEIVSQQTHALRSWLCDGGGLVALHSTLVQSNDADELSEVIGGRFVAHPPKQRFTVTSKGFPWLAQATEAFDVVDERYEVASYPDVEPNLVTTVADRELTLAWTRQEGTGRVAYSALGHDVDAWFVPEYRRWLVQALDWVSRP